MANIEQDLISHKSQKSQRSAFKPLKKKSENTESKQGVSSGKQLNLGVTKANDKQVTEVAVDNRL